MTRLYHAVHIGTASYNDVAMPKHEELQRKTRTSAPFWLCERGGGGGNDYPFDHPKIIHTKIPSILSSKNCVQLYTRFYASYRVLLPLDLVNRQEASRKTSFLGA